MAMNCSPDSAKWTKPEIVGKTVVEVQGKNRYRGTAVGAHERSVAGHGTGTLRLVEAGKRFRAPADKGRVKFHDHKPQKPPKSKSEIQEKKQAKKKDILTQPMKP